MEFRSDDRAEVTAFASRIGATGSRRTSIFTIGAPLASATFSQDLRPLVDAVASMSGLKPLGDGWQEVSEKSAEWILSQVLEADLAYHCRMMERREARNLASEFVRLVSCGETVARNGHGCRYFTNGCIVDGPTMFTIDGKEMVGWQPATNSTFDTGVVMVTLQRIGLLWGDDED